MQPLRDAAHVAAREIDHQGYAARANLIDDGAVSFEQECFGDPVDSPDRVGLEGVHPGLVLDEGGPYSTKERRQVIQGLPVTARVPDDVVLDRRGVGDVRPAAAGDVEERKYWDDYMDAYEDALSKCSTPWAPWYVVPADRKWYRDLVVARTIVETLEKLAMHFPPPLPHADKIVIPD